MKVMDTEPLTINPSPELTIVLFMKVSHMILAGIIFLGACKKSTGDLFVFQEGVFTGGLGCSAWLIMKEDHTLLQPINLDSFNIHPKYGMPVLFSYCPDTLGTDCVVNIIYLLSIGERRN